MKKYNKIAVMIRGQLRTWNFCKHNHFYTYEKIAHHVDYYFATWDDAGYDFTAIKRDFDGKNLIELIACPFRQIYGTAWCGPPWLSYNLSLYRNAHGQKYDVVFDQRTDTLNWLQWEPYEIDPMTMYTPDPPFKNSDERTALGYGASGVTDYGFMSDSHTYDLVSQRFKIMTKVDKKSPEYRLENYCLEKNIVMPGGSVLNQQVCRPAIFLDHKDPIIIVNPDIIERLNTGLSLIWKKLTREQKVHLCESNGISANDYVGKPDHYTRDL
jgi:hypothetical protein